MVSHSHFHGISGNKVRGTNSEIVTGKSQSIMAIKSIFNVQRVMQVFLIKVVAARSSQSDLLKSTPAQLKYGFNLRIRDRLA